MQSKSSLSLWKNALRDVFHTAQEGVKCEDTTLNSYFVYKDKKTGLQECGGRIQSIDEDKTVPLFACQPFSPERHTKTRNVAVGDIMWIADSNALGGQYRLSRVVKANSNMLGVVRDVKIRIIYNYPGSNAYTKPKEDNSATNIPATISHQDVWCLIEILPVEEQKYTPKMGETNV